MFTFNPARVPSFRINAQGQPDPAGTREPICADCVDRFNRRRAAAGLDPIVPLPGAYEPFGPEDLDT
jgi:hypothetical protein